MERLMNAAEQELTTRFIGGALAMALIIIVGIGVGLFLARKAPGQRIVLWPVVVAAGLVLLSVLSDRPNPAIADAGEQQRPNPNAEVFRQPIAPGATMLLDESALRKAESGISNALANALGISLSTVKSSAQVLDISGKKFLYVSSTIDSSSVGSALILGGNGEMVKIVCASRGSVSAKFKGTQCGQVADETFKISVASVDGDI
jgi:hypothetical protein